MDHDEEAYSIVLQNEQKYALSIQHIPTYTSSSNRRSCPLWFHNTDNPGLENLCIYINTIDGSLAPSVCSPPNPTNSVMMPELLQFIDTFEFMSSSVN